jgi:hypothetical protein
MANQRNRERAEKIGGTAMSRRNLLEMAGLAVAAAAVPSGMVCARPLELTSEPAAAPAADAISPAMNTLSIYMSEAGAKALPDEVAEKTKEHVLDTIAAMVSGSDLPPGRTVARKWRR